MPPHYAARAKAPDNPLKLRAAELGVRLVEREWIPSSRWAHECTEYARTDGKLAAFHAAVLSAYWSDGADIHDWSVLERCATGAGVDAAAMRESVDAGQWRSAVDERVEAAHEMGIRAVPTFVIDGRFAIQGAQTADVFRQALRRL